MRSENITTTEDDGLDDAFAYETVALSELLALDGEDALGFDSIRYIMMLISALCCLFWCLSSCLLPRRRGRRGGFRKRYRGPAAGRTV